MRTAIYARISYPDQERSTARFELTWPRNQHFQGGYVDHIASAKKNSRASPQLLDLPELSRDPMLFPNDKFCRIAAGR